MEAIQYEYATRKRSQRIARLLQAASAFLAEPVTARDVRCVALLVPVPAPSAEEGRAPAAPLSKKPKPRKNSSRAPRGAAAGARVTPRKYPALRAKLLARRQRRQWTVRFCTAATYQRLHQAMRDAAILNRLLNQQQTMPAVAAQKKSPRSVEPTDPLGDAAPAAGPRRRALHARKQHAARLADGPAVTVTVGAVLRPRTVADLSLYVAWQTGAGAGAGDASSTSSLSARRFSPLLAADFIVLDLGNFTDAARSLVTPRQGQKERLQGAKRVEESSTGDGRKSFFDDWEAHGSPRVNLALLLQPHQSLLLDISWCVEAMADGVLQQQEAAPPYKQQRRVREPAVSAEAAALSTFLDDFQSTLKLPKESRVACWLSYGTRGLLHTRLCSAGGAAVDAAGDGGYGAGTCPDDLGGEGASAFGSIPHKSARREEADVGLPENAFLSVHEALRELSRRLTDGPDTLGHHTTWTWLIGYGGSTKSLLAEPQLVDLPRATACSSTPARAALLSSRSQRDLYALLDLLTGTGSWRRRNATGSYAAAAAFLRTMTRRLTLAAAFKSRFRAAPWTLRPFSMTPAGTPPPVAPSRAKKQILMRGNATEDDTIGQKRHATQPAPSQSASPEEARREGKKKKKKTVAADRPTPVAAASARSDLSSPAEAFMQQLFTAAARRWTMPRSRRRQPAAVVSATAPDRKSMRLQKARNAATPSSPPPQAEAEAAAAEPSWWTEDV